MAGITESMGTLLLETMGDMVEDIYYTAYGESEKTIKAHVFREKANQENVRGATNQRNQLRIFISRDDSEGVADVTPNKDSVRIKIDIGSSEYKIRLVRQILSQDAGGYMLAIA